MSWMYQSLNFFVLCCLIAAAEAITDKVLPPQNVSILWVNDFQPGLSWTPPHLVSNHCTYEVSTKTRNREIYFTDVLPPWNVSRIMEGGFLELSIKTICDKAESEPVVVSVSYPEVKNFECYSTSSRHAYCSWSPPSPIQDLRFFYWRTDGDSSSELQECSSYNYTDGVKTGCDLQEPTHCFYNVLINGTLNNTLIRNTFNRLLTDKVRPPGLQWTVTKEAGKFNISWIPPDVLGRSTWEFIINYTECDKKKTQTIKGSTYHRLEIIPNCAYRIAIQARSDKGDTPWSEEKYFEADRDSYAFVYAAVVIPLVIASLAALVLVCCRKNKEQIFPKVPAPLDLLSDISDNNNKSTLYVPREEEENCSISLVIEPQTNKSF